MNEVTEHASAVALREEFRPTLLVGVGGTGIKIADRIYQLALERQAWFANRLAIVGIDTDENDLRRMQTLGERQLLKISTPDSIYRLLDKHPEVEKSWFGPRTRFPQQIQNMTLLDGA